jgi:hypothetical protein
VRVARSGDDDGLGFRFWVGLVGIAVGIGIGLLILFLVIGHAFMAWGLFGGFLVLSAVLLFIGWLFDRREARSAADWAGES